MKGTGAFLWGVATSAYQIEGARENDWMEWERQGRLNARQDRCGQATGHRRLWRSDLALLPRIGANAYRFSVEWSRIEPRRGVFDETALAFEAERVAHLRRLGIEPVVTLHHYTHPPWFWEDGGWEEPESVERFAAFAGAVAKALAGPVRYWVTLNEPIVFLLGGYMGGLIPPGKRRFASAARALEHLLRAHVAASAAIRDVDAGARIGIAHNMLDFAPDRPASLLDRRLVDAAESLYNRTIVEAVGSGKVRWAFPGEGSVTLRIPDLPAATDYLGVNYYSRVHLRFRGLPGRAGDFFYRDREDRGLTDMGWEVHPNGFGRVLRAAGQSGRPIIVTENGIATRDDRRRRDFLREHVLVLAHARRSGLPIEGYFHWSLLDNFEWLEGFAPRFGLVEVDYATLARRMRLSAALFAALGRDFLAEPAAAEG